MNQNDAFYTTSELRERLSISTFVFWDDRPVCEQSLMDLAAHGIHKIELLENPQQFDMADAGSMRLVGRMCDTCGIEIIGYHANQTNFSGIETEKDRIARVDKCRRQIDTMLSLKGVVWGPHVMAGDATAIRCYQELSRHIDGTDAVITVENFGGQDTRISDRMTFLESIGHRQVGMILDIGHVVNDDGVNPMTLAGGPTKVLNSCRKHLKHLHLHGFKNGADHHPPQVEGDGIQWVELFRKLGEIGYAGVFNFEPAAHANAIAATASMPERLVALGSGA